MNWLYKQYLPYCQAHGMNLQSEDMRYISQLLSKVCPIDRRPMMVKYFNAWQAGMHNAVCGSQRQAMGRKFANKCLVEECKKLNRY